MIEREGFGGFSVLMAFLGGATAGAVAALLLTPKNGEETREQLRRIANTAKDKVVKAPRAIKEAYSQGAEVAKDAFVSSYQDEDGGIGTH